MSIKRDFQEADDGEILDPQPKRPRTNASKTNSSKTRQHQHSNIDPTWGQKYVFSSIENASTIPQGEESEFEDDSDAMAYLMSVRQQACSIPHLLVAPKAHIGPQLPAGFTRDTDDEEEEGEIDGGIDTTSVTDSRGYYEDGAYIGISEGEGKTMDEQNPEQAEKALHEAYFASIMAQYLHMRSILHSELPDNAASQLSKHQPTDAAPFGRYSSTTKIWSSAVRNNNPHPIQVALLSKDSVILILRVILGGKFLRGGQPIPERTSLWLWALLARLPDRGELNHTEIGWVRDLGHRAELLGRSLSEMALLREELSETGFGANDDIDESSSDEEVVAEVVDEGDEHVDTPEVEAQVPDSSTAPEAVIPPDESKDEEDAEEGEVNEQGEANEQVEVNEDGHGSDSGDVAMDLASDSEADEGEVTEDPADPADAKLEEAKRGLLAQLSQAEDERRQEEASQRARMNMRATLNMVLTIAGEFYGQRDLLEFREPFVGM